MNINLNEWIDGMNQVDISEYVNEERRLRPSQDDFTLMELQFYRIVISVLCLRVPNQKQLVMT